MSYKKALEKFESTPIKDQVLIRHEFFIDTPVGFDCCTVGFLTKPLRNQYLSDTNYPLLLNFLNETYGITSIEAEKLMTVNDFFIGTTADRFKHMLKFLQEQVKLENE